MAAALLTAEEAVGGHFFNMCHIFKEKLVFQLMPGGFHDHLEERSELDSAGINSNSRKYKRDHNDLLK